MNTVRYLQVSTEEWPISGSFVIARGARTAAKVITITLTSGGHKGYGECVPYRRYGETIASVLAQINTLKSQIERGISRQELQSSMSAGAARNAVDCALWDLEAKQSGTPVWQSAGVSNLSPATTAFTISLGTPEKMASDCRLAEGRSLLKVKLGGDGDLERMIAVREAAPDARLILDANEAWSAGNFGSFMEMAKEIGADLIEQPLPADSDEMLEAVQRLVPVCADESLHTREELATLRRRYDCINIKLDKAGGLTEALKLKQEARAAGFQIMIGCMVSTSLSMAPAFILTHEVEFVDLDGPLLLAKDRDPGMAYDGSTIFPPPPSLWG